MDNYYVSKLIPLMRDSSVAAIANPLINITARALGYVDDGRRCDARLLRLGDKNPARILGLEGYGIEVGCHADYMVLDARDPIEAIRLRAARTTVIRRGKVVSHSQAVRVTLSLEGRPSEVNFRITRQ